jgi:hypothetical protein
MLEMLRPAVHILTLLTYGIPTLLNTQDLTLKIAKRVPECLRRLPVTGGGGGGGAKKAGPGSKSKVFEKYSF